MDSKEAISLLIAAGVRHDIASEHAIKVAVWGEDPHELARWVNRAADLEAEWLRRFDERLPRLLAAYESAAEQARVALADAPYGINGRTEPVRYRFGRYQFRRVLYPAWLGPHDSGPRLEAVGVPPVVRGVRQYFAGRIYKTAKRVALREAGLKA